MVLEYENRQVEVEVDCNNDGSNFITSGTFIDNGQILDLGELWDLEYMYADRIKEAPSPAWWRRGDI
jgi:hypothetical protein